MSNNLRLSDEIRQRVFTSVRPYAIGNSNRKMKDVAIDLINNSGMKWSYIASGCFLSEQTIKNLATEVTRNPQSETIERVFRFFGVALSMDTIIISQKYMNKEKER